MPTTKKLKHKLKIKKNNNYNYKNNTYSRNICNLSTNLLQSYTNKTLYTQYNKHISTNINKFAKTQTVLLNKIFNSKNTTNFTLSYKEIILDDTNKIPPFLEIFKYLLSKPEFINNFRLDEQKLLQSNLLQNHTKEFCYNFLDKSNLGQKILELYYSMSIVLKTELSAKYQSINFHSLLINSFTSFKIIEDLEFKIKKLISFSIEWKGKKIDNLVYMFMYEKSLVKYHNKLENIGNEIIKRILFFNEFLNIDKLPNKFIIFLTDKKKEIDDYVISHIHFKTINVNTAVTNGQDIIIYREQELLKSIFHELIHFHNLDFRNIPDTIIQYLIKTHNIKSDNEYLLYECVTETLANILNNIFLSSNIKEFINNLQTEILFSTFQVAKILNICKYKSWDEFSNLDNSRVNMQMTHNKMINNNNSNPHKHFKQDSCIMSYYILKYYIMMNLDIYFKTCLDTKLKFIQTTEGFNNLIHIFNLSRKELIIMNIMNKLLNSLGKGNNIKSKNKITKTLRMTCLESKLFSKNSI
jgi:hypothetical protein